MAEDNSRDVIHSGGGNDVSMQDSYGQQDVLGETIGETMTSNYTDDNDMSLIDPVLAYMLQE
jgi:hypothetical protein